MRFIGKVLSVVMISLLGISLASAAGKSKKPESPLNALYRVPGNQVAGNPAGRITVIEFFDYNCGYCRLMYPKVQALIQDDNNLRVIFREYPVLSPRSILPAKAALAAQKQGKYPQLHEAMMQARMPLGQEEILRLAAGVKLDPVQLKKDMESPSVIRQVQDNLAVGQALNIQGVPTFIVARTSPPSTTQPQAAVGPSIDVLKDMIKKAESQN